MSLKKNIIYIYFKGKHLITSKSQYQYNHGQYLYFADLNLPQAFEVHFSNKERGESKTQIGSNKLVEIPDKFFWSGALQIYAWVYLHDGTDDGETIYEVRIPLIKRAKPIDEEPLPAQQLAIDKAIAELNNAVDITNENADKTNADKIQVATIKEEVIVLKEEINTTASTVNQDAQTAQTAAERSEQSAQNSAESERKALDYSDEAKGYAQSAFESKDTVSQKAQVATDAAAEAKDFRDEAETFKNEAEQIKQNVVDYRNETKGYRDEALTAKNDAQDSANAAQETLEQVTQAGEEIIESVRDLGSRYATQAETAANNAQASASQASASASASAQSASEAQSASTNAQTYALNSGNKAVESAQSAQASANSATQAQGYANDANTSAQSASGYASDALTFANTASNKATEASTSAQTASTKATESAQSASQALGYKTDAESAKTASQTAQGLAESARDTAVSAKTDAESARDDAVQAKEDAESAVASISGALAEKAPVITDTASGAIASFSDGADNLPLKSLVVDINPVQDLHGQDSPYPAGGGKNLFDPSVYSAYLQSDGKYRARASQINPIQIPIPSSLLNTPCTFSFYADMTNAGTLTNVSTQAVVGGVSKNGNLVQNGSIGRSTVTFTPTSTDDYIHITFGSNGSDEFTFYNIQLEASSAVTDYAPYENLCPISGWTEVDVEQRGVNLFDKTTVMDGYIDNNSGERGGIGTSMQYRCTDYIRVEGGGNYYIKTDQTMAAWGTWYDESKTYISGITSYANATITAPSKAKYARLTISNINTGNPDTFSVNYPATDHDYHPYTGRSITINLGQTVYGGKLDVLSGELVIDRAMVDLGTLDWMVSSGASSPSGKLFRTMSDIAKPRERFTPNNVICTIYKTADQNVWFTSNYLDLTVGIGNTGRIVVRDDRYDNNVVAFKSAISGVQIVYELAEPITIQLTPNQVNSLLGVNNIWADSGDTEVEYRADTKLFIERLTAPDSADMIADANITSGQYFMVGNSLFKATANIANGTQIIVGTNAVRKSLSEALNEINA